MLPPSGSCFQTLVTVLSMQYKLLYCLSTLLIVFHFLSPAVWTVMPTPVPLPRLQPLSSLLPRLPLPHLQEVRCLLGQWPVPVATLRLRHLYLEPMQLHLPLVLHLPLFQLVPPTSQPTRCPPHLLRPQWSTMPAVICWLLYVWVRAHEDVSY